MFAKLYNFLILILTLLPFLRLSFKKQSKIWAGSRKWDEGESNLTLFMNYPEGFFFKST